MRYQDLQAYEALSQDAAEDAHWQALIDLEPCLEQLFVEAGDVHFDRGVPSRLAVFVLEDKHYFVVAADDGQVFLGRVEDMQLVGEMRYMLGDFDPQRHEIQSIAVTAGQRFAGNTLDLWITVQDYSQEQSAKEKRFFAYHAILGSTAEGVYLRPAQDDSHRDEQNLWPPQSITRQFPDWLLRWNFCVASEHVAQVPPDVTACLPKKPFVALDAITWRPPLLLYSLEGKLHISRIGDGAGGSATISLGERAYCLEMRRHSNGYDIIAGCDDRSLRILRLNSELAVTAKQTQYFADFPVAVALIDAGGFRTMREDREYELLALFRSRDLTCLHHVGSSRLQAGWRWHWGCLLKAGDTGAFLLRAEDWLEKNPQRKQAILAEALRRCLDHATAADPATRQTWLERLLPLYRPFRRERSLPTAGLDAVISKVKEYLEYLDNKRDRWPSPSGGDFAAALLFRLYTGECQLLDRSRVDLALRHAISDAAARRDPELERLRLWLGDADENADGDDPGLQLWRLCRKLDRWANLLWPEREFSLPNSAISAFCTVEPLAADHDPYDRAIVLADDKGLGVFWRSKAEGCSRSLPFHQRLLDGQKILAISALPDADSAYSGVAVLREAAGGSVGLSILRIAEANTPAPSFAVGEPQAIDSVHAAFSYVLCACRHRQGGSLLAVLANRGNQAKLMLWHIRQGQALPLLQNHALPEVHWVSGAQLAADAQGYYLVTASDQCSANWLYRIDENGGCQAIRAFDILKRGATTACFDRGQDPQYLMCGGRSGLVWCAALAGNQRPSEVLWCYRLQGPVQFIHALSMGGTPCFLLGSSSGELCLLQADNGRRRWRIRLPRGVCYAGVFLSGLSRVPVLQSPDVLTLFRRLSEHDRESLWQDVQASFGRFPPDGAPAGQQAFTATYRALQALNSGRRLPDILPAIEVREANLRVLLYAVEHAGLIGQEASEPLIAALSPREMMLLLNFADTQDQSYLAPMRERLFQLAGSVSPQFPLPDSAKTAMATYLQHWRRHNPGHAEVLQHLVPEGFFKGFPWVSHEFALLLLEATQRGLPQAGLPLLPYLFEPLTCLRPRLLSHVHSLLNPDSEDARDCHALLRWMDEAAYSRRVVHDSLQRLVVCFSRVVESASDAQKLLLALLRLQTGYLRHQESDWQDWRHDAMAHLAGLVAVAQSCGPLDGPLYALLKGLKTLLLQEIPPQDTDSRETRLDWLGRLRRSLDSQSLPSKKTLAPEWPMFFHEVLRAAQKTLQWQLDQEYQHLLALVRPRLDRPTVQYGEGRRIHLRLQAEPDGDSRLLRDVSIEYRSNLLPPGSTRLQRNYLEYPATVRKESLMFDGFLPGDADHIALDAELQDAQGYRSRYCWHFVLPAAKPAVQAELPPPLQAIYEDFFQQLCRWREPLGLAVIDEELGRGRLLHDWEQRFPGRRLDLDDKLRDYGPGRRYSGQALDSDFLIQPLQEWLAGVDKQSLAHRIPLLIGPLEETLERLLQIQGMAVLAQWLRRLANLGADAPPLRLLAGTSLAARLRGLAKPPLAELALHRHLLLNSERLELEQAVLDSLAAIPRGAIAEQAEFAWQSLGKDVRLLRRYLQLAEESGRAPSLAAVRDDVAIQDAVRREMRSLDSFALAALIGGALACCQVLLAKARPGLVAEQDYFSTTRVGMPKRLQKGGEPFSQASLQRLRADLSPPEQVLAQGLGQRETKAEATGLLPLLLGRPRELEAVFARLQQWGLGGYYSGVFRTHSPYREIIAGLYSQHLSANMQSKDAAVFAALADSGRDPSELLRPDELAGVKRNILEALLPAASSDEREAMRGLAQCWLQNRPLDNAAPILRKLFDESQAVAAPAEHWSAVLQDAGLLWLGLGKAGLRHRQRGREQEAQSYLFWLRREDDSAPAFDFDRFCQLAEQALQHRSAWLQRHDYEQDLQRPRFVLTGPGCEALSTDAQQRVALWRFADYARAAWHGSMQEGLWRRARAQLNLSSFSPYRTASALPPGSPLFVGRAAELDFILQRLAHSSVLIVGCRRVGKTSLLNQVLNRLRLQGDSDALLLDLQGVADSAAFLRALGQQADDPRLEEAVRSALAQPVEDVRQALYRLANAALQRGRRCVLLLNEIDAIARQEPALLELLRGLNDQGLMRFVLVGYAIIGSWGSPDSPLFHFTEGTHYGGKAISLAELAPAAARQLLDLLEAQPLLLRWRSAEDKKAGYEVLLARSYRIPWVLQRYGQLLVEHLGKEQREELCLEDAKRVLQDHGDVVWDYIANIEYGSLGLPGRRGQGLGLKLLLYSVARRYYFLGGGKAPIHDKRLQQRSALDLGFSSADVRAAAREAAEALLRGNEHRAFLNWLDELDLSRALRLLTLTLMLEPDPREPDRYAFLLHIFPLELYRLHGDKDPRLDSLIVQTTVDFLRS